MKSRLFWRMFWAFTATLILSVAVLSALMIVMVREERREALEGEVLIQAREVAQLISQRDFFSLFSTDFALNTTLNWKIEEIQQTYGAGIWLVSGAGNALVLGGQNYTSEQLNDAEVLRQIYRVLSGEEIRVQGLIPELGANMVTLGVPWRAGDGRVRGAVLLHISIDQLQVDYSDMIRNSAIAAAVALLTGTALAYVISRRQAAPLQQINQAVTQFAAGNFESRVDIRGDDELAQLGRSFNQMAADLDNLESSRRSFVASVSHELRSPLTCIGGYVEGMLDGTIAPEEQKRYLEVVKSETNRLSKLVSELLDLSRFESGKFPLSISRFDVNELIVVEMLKFEQRLEEKHIDVEINFHDKQCFVNADADRIRQVVTNLVDNAVKFVNESGTLEVETLTVDALCYVTVKNSGPAISPEDLPFIFDRFYKADKAHTSGMGTGLGLSIVKRILEQHGQKIKASSGMNGTSFVFTLDMAPAELPQ